MTLTKPRKPKKKRTEFAITAACGVYIDLNGDVVETKKKLGKGWSQNDLRWYEEKRRWPLLLNKTQSRVNEELVEDAVARRMDQMTRLHNVRKVIYRQIVTLEGNAATRAGNLEGVAGALCKIIELERIITGDDRGTPPPSAGVFVFLRDKILNERDALANRFEGTALGDPADRLRI